MLLILIVIIYLILLDELSTSSAQRRFGPFNIGILGLLASIINGINLIIIQSFFIMSSYSFIMYLGPLIFLFLLLLFFLFLLPMFIIDLLFIYFMIILLSSILVFVYFLLSYSSFSKYSIIGSFRIVTQFIAFSLIFDTLITIFLYVSSFLSFSLFSLLIFSSISYTKSISSSFYFYRFSCLCLPFFLFNYCLFSRIMNCIIFYYFSLFLLSLFIGCWKGISLRQYLYCIFNCYSFKITFLLFLLNHFISFVNYCYVAHSYILFNNHTFYRLEYDYFYLWDSLFITSPSVFEYSGISIISFTSYYSIFFTSYTQSSMGLCYFLFSHIPQYYFLSFLLLFFSIIFIDSYPLYLLFLSFYYYLIYRLNMICNFCPLIFVKVVIPLNPDTYYLFSLSYLLGFCSIHFSSTIYLWGSFSSTFFIYFILFSHKYWLVVKKGYFPMTSLSLPFYFGIFLIKFFFPLVIATFFISPFSITSFTFSSFPFFTLGLSMGLSIISSSFLPPLVSFFPSFFLPSYYYLSFSSSLWSISFSSLLQVYCVPLFLFITFNLCILVESNRVPFDLPEAESELVAGFMTEFSSLYFSIIILSEYFSLIIFVLFMIILYNLNILLLLIILLIYCLTRATLNRLKYDELLSFGWYFLLIITFSYFILLIF